MNVSTSEALFEMEIEKPKRIQAFWEYAFKNNEFFDFFGNLKNRYRNRWCRCGSGEKMKNCHGIKYNSLEYEKLFSEQKILQAKNNRQAG